MEILKKAAIAVSQELSSKEEATKLAGTLLKDTGSIQEEYIDSMLYKLENEGFATYIGNGVAIPHGMEEGKKYINETAISIIQSHTGVDWNGETAHIIVGIAAKDDEHIDVLSKLADLIEDIEDAKKIWVIDSIDQIYELFS
jgi:mannitol/fructose-specific phosphotransferase system IIA component